MATATKKKIEKKQESITREMILDKYMDYVLENGKEPASVFRFMKGLDSTESEFYKYFGDFSAIPKVFWSEMVENSIKTCEKDKNWTEYSSREKFLGFYFTLIENLKNNRSFTLWTMKNLDPRKDGLKLLSSARTVFKDFATTTIGMGLETEEVIERPVISKNYDEGLWIQFLFILHFWKNDDSIGFENTDAAIEKSVNLSFELMGKSTLDSMIDFGKFLLNTSILKK